MRFATTRKHLTHSEEDIKKAVEFIRTNLPGIPATRGEAIKRLDSMQETAEFFVEVVKKTAKKVTKVTNN